MPAHFLSAAANHNQPLVLPHGECLQRTYFNLVRLEAGQTMTYQRDDCETLCVVLRGEVEITVGGTLFAPVGGRASIWDGPADSVYCGTKQPVTIRARCDQTEVAIAGGLSNGEFAPFRIPPSEVSMVEVGSAATHSRRRIFHILGQNAAGRAGNLLVSELYADAGCWSGYPPHKHDEERPPEETAFEEVYHYRFRPGSGFGAQFLYESPPETTASAPRVMMTRHGDTCLIARGYHPTVASPGHEGYIFTILVGHHQRSLIQYFDPAHDHLLEKIPGIQAMRDKFK